MATTRITTIKDRGLIGTQAREHSVLPPDKEKLSATDYSTLSTPVYERRGNYLVSQHHSTNERFWDTLMPSLPGIWKADGANVFYGTAGTDTGGASTVIDVAIFYAGLMPKPDEGTWNLVPLEVPHKHYEMSSSVALTNLNWLNAFPYEPRYSSIERITDVFRTIETTKEISTWGYKKYPPPTAADYDPVLKNTHKRIDKAILALNIGDYDGVTNSWKLVKCGLNWKGVSVSGSYDIGQPIADKIEFTKSVYGYSSPDAYVDLSPWKQGQPFDSNLSSLYPSPFRRLKFRTRSFRILTTSGSNIPRSFPDKYHSLAVQIEGWKYGILNGFRQTSKAIFRRDRYGQFRDMLEQRLDGKFYIDEQPEDYSTFDASSTIKKSVMQQSYDMTETFFKHVTDSPVQVKFIGPDGKVCPASKTDSSNLSSEMTSSIPYFDGQIKNKPSPWTIKGFPPSTIDAVTDFNRNKTIISSVFDNNGNVTLGPGASQLANYLNK